MTTYSVRQLDRAERVWTRGPTYSNLRSAKSYLRGISGDTLSTCIFAIDTDDGKSPTYFRGQGKYLFPIDNPLCGGSVEDMPEGPVLDMSPMDISEILRTTILCRAWHGRQESKSKTYTAIDERGEYRPVTVEYGWGNRAVLVTVDKGPSGYVESLESDEEKVKVTFQRDPMGSPAPLVLRRWVHADE